MTDDEPTITDSSSCGIIRQEILDPGETFEDFRAKYEKACQLPVFQ